MKRMLVESESIEPIRVDVAQDGRMCEFGMESFIENPEPPEAAISLKESCW